MAVKALASKGAGPLALFKVFTCLFPEKQHTNQADEKMKLSVTTVLWLPYLLYWGKPVLGEVR